MSQHEELIERMRSTPQNIRFEEVLAVTRWLGLSCRNPAGSHDIFTWPGSGLIVTVARPKSGGHVKAVYIRTLLSQREAYGIIPGGGNDE